MQLSRLGGGPHEYPHRRSPWGHRVGLGATHVSARPLYWARPIFCCRRHQSPVAQATSAQAARARCSVREEAKRVETKPICLRRIRSAGTKQLVQNSGATRERGLRLEGPIQLCPVPEGHERNTRGWLIHCQSQEGHILRHRLSAGTELIITAPRACQLGNRSSNEQKTEAGLTFLTS